MKKQLFLTLFVILILIGIGATAYYFIPKELVKPGFTPIYCKNYEFTCCNEKFDKRETFDIDNNQQHWECPAYASKCIITSVQRLDGYFLIGSRNCRIETTFYGDDYWTCDDDGKYTEAPITLSPGESIHGATALVYPTIFIDVYTLKLYFCGDSGCTVGVRLKSDQCVFQTNDNIYDNYGRLTGTGTKSYTVPQDECYLSFTGARFICGHQEEICSTNQDCGGHTYGNQECYARTLQTYGCVEFGKRPSEEELNFLPFESKPREDEFDYGHRCDIIEAKSVQCCGDADCGTGAFCDKTTWTCEETAECRQDVDCGVSIQCDIEKLELKKPYCNIFGKCDWEKIENVNCCSDANCQSGWYCDENYNCKEGEPSKISCPYECCEDEKAYFDRKCGGDEYCCPNHVCSIEGNCEITLINCAPWFEIAGKTIIPNLSIECLFGGFFKQIKIISTLLIFIVTLTITYPWLRKNYYKRRDEKALAWIFTFAISIVFAVLVYVIFYLGLLLFILYLIFRSLLPKWF